MYACIYIPEFALQAVLRHEPELVHRPVALLEDGRVDGSNKDKGRWRILHLNAAARKLGVTKGMTGTQGQARSSELVLKVRSLGNEISAQEAIMQWTSDLTPRIESHAAGIGIIDLRGTRHLLKQQEDLGEKCIEAVRKIGLFPQIGLAANPDLALLAAKHARPFLKVAADDSSQSAFLDPLPVTALPLMGDMNRIFTGWGIETLGQLKQLPKNDVIERLGSEMLPLWEIASGGSDRPLRLHVPNETMMEAADFDFGIERLEGLIFAINRYLTQILNRLALNHMAVAELKLKLTFEDGRHHEHLFKLPEPTRKQDVIVRVVHTYLEHFTAEAPVTGLSLEARPARPVQQQLSLFESTLRDPNQFSETVARLEALVGQGNVGNPVPDDSHQADKVRVESFHPDKKSSFREGAGQRLGLPLRRFRPPSPVSVEVRDGKVVVRIASARTSGRVLYSFGPWKHSGDWWDKAHWECEEWDIEMEQGGLYRLVKEGDKWTIEGAYD